MKIKVPKFGDDSARGTIISWFVGEGSEVKKGQDLLELETDKALMRIDSPVDGVVRAIYRGEGEDVSVDDELADIEEKAETQ